MHWQGAAQGLRGGCQTIVGLNPMGQTPALTAIQVCASESLGEMFFAVARNQG